MEFYFAGVIHNDVTHRKLLREWLENLSKDKTARPTFIAVEYDKELFQQIIEQRPHIRKRAEEKWPGLDGQVLDAIELSLGYEGDTHLEIFPDVDILWLNQGRENNVSSFANLRLQTYQMFIGDTDPLGMDVSEVISILSQRAKANSPPNKNFNRGRNKKWHTLIRNRIEGKKDNWAIIVVGLSYTQSWDGNLRYLLENDGHDCLVTDLTE